MQTMELMKVSYFDPIHMIWRPATVSTTSDVAKALSGEIGGRFDFLREIYKNID